MTAFDGRLLRNGVALRISDSGGSGMPMVFQHGLCGDATQTAEVFPTDARFRRLTLECRGHGDSEAGDPAVFSIATFADDVAAMIEALGGGSMIVGGISMGAAIALRLAVTRPDLVRGLVLARPAWGTEAAPTNMMPNAEVGRLLSTLPAKEARRVFMETPSARRLAEEAPDNLSSLTGFFSRTSNAVTAALLQALSADGPGVSQVQVQAIRVPTLVVGHGRDAIHPLEHARLLASLVPGAKLAVITPKADDRRRYVDDFRGALAAFLEELA